MTAAWWEAVPPEHDMDSRKAELRDSSLFGTWEIDRTDTDAVREYGNVSMRFYPDGVLTYVFHRHGRDDVILLRWRTEREFIVTDQPTQPREEWTEYHLSTEGRLILRRGDSVSRYVKHS